MKILYTNKGLMTESEYKDIGRFDKTITSYGEATNDSSPIVDFSKYVIKEARDQRCEECGKKLNMDDKCPACDYESLADDEECRYCGSTRHSSKKCELSKPAFKEELQHSQTAFIDTTAPVVSEKDCIEEIDLSDLMNTQMDDMKSSSKANAGKEKHCSECGSELDPGGYCMSGCDDEDGKATLYAEDAELDDAIFGKKADKQKKDPDDLDLWEEEDPTPFVEPWRLMHRSLLASSRKLSKDWPDIYKGMTAKGVDGPKAMKFIRACEATIDNMTQMLQLTKDTSRARAHAANAIKRNPSIAKYIPKELGGAFEETDMGSMKESAPPGMEDVVLALKKKFGDKSPRPFQIAWAQYNKKHGKSSIKKEADLSVVGPGSSNSEVNDLVALLKASGFDQDPADEFSFEAFSSSFDGSAYVDIDPLDSVVHIKLRAAGEMGPDQLTGLFDVSDLKAIEKFLGRFGFALGGMEKDMNENSKKNSKGFRVSIAELRNIVAKVVKEEYDREEDGYLASLTWGQFPSYEILEKAIEDGFTMELQGRESEVFDKAMVKSGIKPGNAIQRMQTVEGFKQVVEALMVFDGRGDDEDDPELSMYVDEDEANEQADIAQMLASDIMDVIGVEWI